MTVLCASHIAFKRQVRPSATRTSLKLGLVSRPASSGRLARLVEALGAIRFACTGRQRASAGPQKSRRHAAVSSCRADAPDRSCRAAAPSSLRRAPAQTRRAIQGAGASGQVRLRQCLLLECSEPGVRLAGRPRCRATQQRAPPTRGGQAVAAAGHLACCNAIRRSPPTASASGTHNWSQCFIAVVLVLVRQMRTRKAGLAARRHAVTARVAAL